MRIFDARTESHNNLFRLIAAEETQLQIEGRAAKRPLPGDRLIAMNGEMFRFAKVWNGGRVGANTPGSFRATLTKER